MESVVKPRWKVDTFAGMRSLAYFRDRPTTRRLRTITNTAASRKESNVDHNTNRNPKIHTALRQIMQHEDLPEAQVFKLDVRTLANGEVTCRYLLVGEDEWEGFVIPGA
jgi:hypothetical protein